MNSMMYSALKHAKDCLEYSIEYELNIGIIKYYSQIAGMNTIALYDNTGKLDSFYKKSEFILKTYKEEYRKAKISLKIAVDEYTPF